VVFLTDASGLQPPVANAQPAQHLPILRTVYLRPSGSASVDISLIIGDKAELQAIHGLAMGVNWWLCWSVNGWNLSG
jgi:hypothetical protein